MKLLKEKYDGLQKIERLPQYLKDFLFLPDIKKLLEEYNFTVLYRAAYNYLDITKIYKVTELLDTLGIDPLIYLDYIPRYFLAYSKIKSVNIPKHIKEISGSAFYNCRSLTSVTIPDSVRNINNYAFFNCINLNNINYTGTKEQWSKITLGDSWGDYSPIKKIHCSDGGIEF